MSKIAIWLPLILSLSCSKGPVEIPASNLLLITLDTTRADAIGCYGGPSWVSPTLDHLAEEGVRFDQARTVAPITLPSHATILTGLFPFEHGVRDNASYRLPKEVTTLAERLKGQGYSTLAVMGAYVLHSTFGLDQGFDVYSDVPRVKLNLAAEEDQRLANEVVDEALRILKATDRGKPVFLWVHFFDPHWPYTPPEEYYSRAMESKEAGSSAPGNLNRQKYLGEVAFMDNEIERLLNGVRKVLPEDELLTAVVADHGEGLGDHAEDTHAFKIYDTTVRIPMILHHEGLPGGTVVHESVSTNDLAPTLLSLLGIDFKVSTGTDLSPLYMSKQKTSPESLAYFETCHPFINYNWAPLFGLIQGEFKLIYGPEPELYNMNNDPGEMNNIISNHPVKVEAMKKVFDSLVSRTRPSARITLESKNIKRIEALGYAASSRTDKKDSNIIPGTVPQDLSDSKKGQDLMNRCTRARELLLRNTPDSLNKAVTIIRGVLKEDPDNPTFLTHAGTILYKAKKYSEALNALSKSLKKLESPSTREVLASCYYKLGYLDDAIRVLKKNVALHPYDLMSRFKLGDALIQKGKPEEALVHLNFFLANHAAKDSLNTMVEKLKKKAETMIR